MGSTKARLTYDRIVAEWLANGRTLPNPTEEVLVAHVMLAYLKHAKGYYRKDGKLTNEYTLISNALAHVRALYADTLADDFGPLALEVVRNRMVATGWSKPTGRARSSTSRSRESSGCFDGPHPSR